ncbi:nuclear transport factor 2 family protein [Neobacillus sp. 179-C4.2 HS]|uniref:Nuclear transport factor 2 family protein n=1 Tax=Neobacillus driksii TaxID=3035913 RepID=A0ABV4YTK0_9BACI|nr:nuclear transport factor 2 family protein [Neobacillus sp. 179.-C4.2 HS]MDP5194232.1 steroid delta-isomerase [Neobacillus sp. 179.-C4.2 HS]
MQSTVKKYTRGVDHDNRKSCSTANRYYNSQDIEGFASTYANDITVYTFPDNTITLSGKQALIERYTETFKKKMFAEIKNRSIVGNKVIDWEIATNGLTGESTSLMAIYEIEDHLISKVWFIRE